MDPIIDTNRDAHSQPHIGGPDPSGQQGDRFVSFSKLWQPRIEAALQGAIPAETEAPARLHAAMRHAMFPGGKRLRPMLAMAACVATGGDPKRAMLPAAALECLHTYSLVHDDLPCMDDDALRRGRPTVHVAFDDATAVLAGDALLTMAFEWAADGGAGAVRALARAAGSAGMVGGQMADMLAEGGGLGGVPGATPIDQVAWIHDRKTAALLTASLEVGAWAGGGSRVPDVLQALRSYGLAVGRAFQIVDDCLDRTGTAEELGKAPGQDQAADKLTYPAILGVPASIVEA